MHRDFGFVLREIEAPLENYTFFPSIITKKNPPKQSYASAGILDR